MTIGVFRRVLLLRNYILLEANSFCKSILQASKVIAPFRSLFSGTERSRMSLGQDSYAIPYPKNVRCLNHVSVHSQCFPHCLSLIYSMSVFAVCTNFLGAVVIVLLTYLLAIPDMCAAHFCLEWWKHVSDQGIK